MCADHSNGRLVWLAVLRARLAIHRQPQSEHVYFDRPRNRCCLSLQRHRYGASLNVPCFLLGKSGQLDLYFEPAAVIVALVLLGQILELRARSQTGSAIRALLGLAPKSARRLNETGSEADVSLDQVQVGDRLHVRPGEKVPVDGVILDGHSSIDQPMVSGESTPVEKERRAKVTELFGKVKTLVVDKTGALTEGKSTLHFSNSAARFHRTRASATRRQSRTFERTSPRCGAGSNSRDKKSRTDWRNELRLTNRERRSRHCGRKTGRRRER